MSGLNPSEARKIGFNESVEVDGLSLHVQTEVLTRGGLVVRTTVLDGGVTKRVESQPVPPLVTEMAALAELAQNQHRWCLDQLKREGASWLEST
jgi:hypothetical protein